MIKWDVLTLGQISRNRYWGEKDTQAYRPAFCTSTLIRAKNCNIIVDPALPEDEMIKVLDGRTGLTPQQVNFVYITHGHSDHIVGLSAFPDARWLTAPKELETVKNVLNGQGKEDFAQKVEAAPPEIAEGVAVIPLPGHTLELGGLEFDSADGHVIVTGDAVMNYDFYQDRQGYFNSVDFGLVRETIELIAKKADIVVPGHGNFFLTHR